MFLDDVLEQLRTGQRPLSTRLSDEALETIEEERIGEEFCRYPFLY
jgi:hypothetical protein